MMDEPQEQSNKRIGEIYIIYIICNFGYLQRVDECLSKITWQLLYQCNLQSMQRLLPDAKQDLLQHRSGAGSC